VNSSIPTPVIDRIAALRAQAEPVVVGIAGSVAAGKTTFAHRLADHVDGVVVSTDGFLLPNDVLEARDLLDRKGFPESFDTDALQWFLRTVRTDERIDGLPRYSHETFDVEISPDPFVRKSVVIVEGINALQPELAALLDLRIYLDASETDLIGWYTTRFERFTEDARQTGDGFYVRFAGQTREELRGTARYVWDLINAPNLRDHIAPTKSNADLVLRKRADHSFEP
jgi:type I pantothenate kinase